MTHALPTRRLPDVALVGALCNERGGWVGGAAGNDAPSLGPSRRGEGVKAVGRGPPYRPLVGGEPARQQLPNLFLGDHLRGIFARKEHDLPALEVTRAANERGGACRKIGRASCRERECQYV